MKYIETPHIKTGDILARPIYGTDGRILISPNTTMTDFLIQKLEILGYAGAYLFEYNETEHLLRFALDEELRIKAATRLRNLDMEACVYNANEITKEVMNASELAAEVNRVTCYDLVTWTHSVDVCTFACMVGIAMGFSDKQLVELSQAALLHDIGKCMVSLDILDKPGRLTHTEFAVIKHHPEYGHGILRHNTPLSDTVLDAVKQHHENEDGTGYPDRLSGGQINPYAKIIHVVDAFEACTAYRPYKLPMEPIHAMDLLIEGCGKQYDRHVVDVLRTVAVIYPVGRTVKLSDGRTATIYENHREALNRPVVKTESGVLIDLCDTKELHILQIIGSYRD